MYRIKWGIDFNDNYNYGAKIAYTSSGDVAYSSPLMPPGVSIKSWYSKTEFHSSRKSPMLPMLLPGHEYELTLHAEFDRKEAVQLLVEFFDKDGFFLEKLVFETTQESFRFPQNATDYQIHMVNKKHQQILFKELVLSTKENQTLLQLLRWWGKVLHYRSYSKNRIVMSKNIHFLIVKRDYLLNPVLRLLHRFWKFCLNKSISESIILIKSPLKWDKIFLYWNPVITMIFLYWLYYLQNQTKKLSQLSLCIVCRKKSYLIEGH